MMEDFVYWYPENIVLDNGESAVLSKEDMKEERLIAIVIAEETVDEFAFFLEDQGFRTADPSWDRGEKYGLSKMMGDPWEMHIRIFENGEIYSHIEVSRDYFEHLDARYIWPVLDEVLSYVKGFTDSFGVFYKKTGQWINKITERVKITVNPPNNVNKWKPVATFAVGVAAGAGIAVFIYELAKYLKEKNKEKENLDLGDV